MDEKLLGGGEGLEEDEAEEELLDALPAPHRVAHGDEEGEDGEDAGEDDGAEEREDEGGEDEEDGHADDAAVRQERGDGGGEDEPVRDRAPRGFVLPRHLRVHLAHAHQLGDHDRAHHALQETAQAPRERHVPDLLQGRLHVVAPDGQEHERDAHPRRHGGRVGRPRRGARRRVLNRPGRPAVPAAFSKY